MTSGTLIASAEEPLVAVSSHLRPDYRCKCGHVLRVFGGGRHRVYFEPGNTRLDDPLMDRLCPRCETALPGRNST